VEYLFQAGFPDTERENWIEEEKKKILELGGKHFEEFFYVLSLATSFKQLEREAGPHPPPKELEEVDEQEIAEYERRRHLNNMMTDPKTGEAIKTPVDEVAQTLLDLLSAALIYVWHPKKEEVPQLTETLMEEIKEEPPMDEEDKMADQVAHGKASWMWTKEKPNELAVRKQQKEEEKEAIFTITSNPNPI
jgi:hypothetical protein